MLHGVEVFTWVPNFSLPQEYLYELVFWEPTEDVIANGFSPVGAGAASSAKVDLDATSRSLPRFQPGKTYLWGVLLVDAANPTQRIKLLNVPQLFVYQFGAGAPIAPTPQPTVMPPEIPSPTAVPTLEPPTLEPPTPEPTATGCPRTDPTCTNR